MTTFFNVLWYNKFAVWDNIKVVNSSRRWLCCYGWYSEPDQLVTATKPMRGSSLLYWAKYDSASDDGHYSSYLIVRNWSRGARLSSK